MNTKLFRVILPVSDIESAVRFYQSALGQPGTRVSSGRHYFHCGGTILACCDPRADGDDYDPVPNSEWIYFSTNDIQQAHRACQERGAKMSVDDVDGTPSGEIHQRPWGERSFYCEDLFGNKLCFVDEATVFTG